MQVTLLSWREIMERDLAKSWILTRRRVALGRSFTQFTPQWKFLLHHFSPRKFPNPLAPPCRGHDVVALQTTENGDWKWTRKWSYLVLEKLHDAAITFLRFLIQLFGLILRSYLPLKTNLYRKCKGFFPRSSSAKLASVGGVGPFKYPVQSFLSVWLTTEWERRVGPFRGEGEAEIDTVPSVWTGKRGRLHKVFFCKVGE